MVVHAPVPRHAHKITINKLIYGAIDMMIIE